MAVCRCSLPTATLTAASTTTPAASACPLLVDAAPTNGRACLTWPRLPHMQHLREAEARAVVGRAAAAAAAAAGRQAAAAGCRQFGGAASVACGAPGCAGAAARERAPKCRAAPILIGVAHLWFPLELETCPHLLSPFTVALIPEEERLNLLRAQLEPERRRKERCTRNAVSFPRNATQLFPCSLSTKSLRSLFFSSFQFFSFLNLFNQIPQISVLLTLLFGSTSRPHFPRPSSRHRLPIVRLHRALCLSAWMRLFLRGRDECRRCRRILDP